jgi:hypothetical protein
MTIVAEFERLKDEFKRGNAPQPFDVEENLVYRIVADNGTVIYGGQLPKHWRQSGGGGLFNLLLANQPAPLPGRLVKILYGTAPKGIVKHPATHLAFAGQPEAGDVSGPWVTKDGRNFRLVPESKCVKVSYGKGKSQGELFTIVVADQPAAAAPTPPSTRARSSSGSSPGSSSGSPSGSAD